MGKRVYLSYLLDEDSVVWPGEPTVRIEQDTSIRQNGYNSFKTTLPNHHGTHMDGPAHFNPDGPRLMELPIEYFCFDRVATADVPKGPGEGIVPEDLKLWEEAIRAADLLLLKTGLCKIRDTQPRVYEAQGAFLTPEVCRYLVETFPDLKAIGLDFLSVGTPANQLSKQAHRILFGCHNGKYIPAIEDMDLRPLFETETPLKSVIAAPLRLGKVDSSQVTVIGEFRE